MTSTAEVTRDVPRCVHCSARKEEHRGTERHCTGTHGLLTNGTYANLRLPEGATCGDCLRFETYCKQIIACRADSISCDWFPIRFVAKEQQS